MADELTNTTNTCLFSRGYVVISGISTLTLEITMPTPANTDLAVWRYGIISRLLHRNEAEETLENELNRLAAQAFRKPNGTLVSFSPETIRKWLYRYRHGGLPALEDAPRKNRGSHGSVPKDSKTVSSSYAESIRGGLWHVFSLN